MIRSRMSFFASCVIIISCWKSSGRLNAIHMPFPTCQEKISITLQIIQGSQNHASIQKCPFHFVFKTTTTFVHRNQSMPSFKETIQCCDSQSLPISLSSFNVMFKKRICRNTLQEPLNSICLSCVLIMTFLSTPATYIAYF